MFKAVVKTMVRKSSLLLVLALLFTAWQPVQRLSATPSGATAAAETPQEKANKAVIQRFYEEVVNQKQMNVLEEIFDAKSVAHELDFGADGGDLAGVLTGLPDVQATIDPWVVEDDLVTAVVTFKGTHQGDLLGIPATGNPVTFSIIDVWRVKNGKIIELWHNVPNNDILEQISAPAPEADDKPHLAKLVGAWTVEATGLHHSPIQTLLVFTSDGIVMGARPPSPFETPAFGNWVSTGPQTAAYTFMAVFGNDKSDFTGAIKVVGTVEYDAATDRWQGPNQAEFTDPSGSTVFTDTGTLSGTRLAIEPLQLPATQTTGATSSETSLEAANKALVQRVYDEIMNQKNLSAAGELFSPNMVIHQFDPAGEGLDLGLLITALPDLQVTVERLLVEGDLVTALVTFSGTHQAEFLGVAPTGNPVTFSLIDLQRVQDGKIVEVWHNVPLTDILEQMQSGPNVITGSGTEPSATAADLIRTTERERLRAMVEADMEVAEQLHADDFQLIHPGGGALSKEEFLGDVASGFIDFLVWEPASEIEVRLYGTNTAVIRYQSLTDIVVAGEQETVNVWHTDVYEKRDGHWQVVWEQSTTIQP